jgi:type IV secretory pathway VirB10-like protein
MSDEQAESEVIQDAPIAESSPAPEATPEQENVDAPEPKKVNKVQERINQLTREKYEARQEAAALEARIKELESNKPVTKEPEVVAPKEDDFEDYSQYQQANAKFVAETASNAAYERIAAENQERERTRQEAARQEELQSKKAAFDANLAEKKGNFEDFEDVAYGHQFMSIEMAERLFEMSKGPEVAYHLGSNLDVAEKIFALPPIQQAIELTKLEFQVEALNPKMVSGAPDPITPLGSSEKVSKDEDDMTDDEWLAARYAQINARKSQ